MDKPLEERTPEGFLALLSRVTLKSWGMSLAAGGLYSCTQQWFNQQYRWYKNAKLWKRLYCFRSMLLIRNYLLWINAPIKKTLIGLRQKYFTSTPTQYHCQLTPISWNSPFTQVFLVRRSPVMGSCLTSSLVHSPRPITKAPSTWPMSTCKN